MYTATATLPGGLWINGECHREAELQPLTGADETFLSDMGRTLLPANRTTELLFRSVKRLGSINDVKPQNIRSLSVGDREALLLHLRRLTFGEALDCVVNCPACAEAIDPDLKVSALLIPNHLQSSEFHEKLVTEDGHAYRVKFRLPTGADQEEAAPLAKTNPNAGADLILRNCVLEVSAEDGRREDGIPQAVAQQLPGVMSELDPQAEITLNLSCPACGEDFSSIFDAAEYIFKELVNRSKFLYREIHILAFNYHWSEADILSMTATKRRIYLDLLQEASMEARPK